MLSMLLKSLRNTAIICFVAIGIHWSFNFFINTTIFHGKIPSYYDVGLSGTGVRFYDSDKKGIIISEERGGLYLVDMSLDDLNKKFHCNISWDDSVIVFGKKSKHELSPQSLKIYWISKNVKE